MAPPEGPSFGSGPGAPDVAPRGRLGPYEILGEIGRGGMGVVYKAQHPELRRTVALKVLIAGEDASEEAIARFLREASAVAKLGHHPNIVPVYDIGQVSQPGRSPLHYFAMHFVEGKPLDRAVDDGEITPRRAAEIAKAIAEALHHAHIHGVLHRDVKPANILLAESGGQPSSPDSQGPNAGTGPDIQTRVPMLTDFGLAKDVDAGSKMTRSGVTLGTPHYMPPEQADGRTDEIDARSDVYSLGATFYEMLTGEPPFQGASVLEVIQKVILADPVPPNRLNPAVDRDLETICLKCLEKERERRYDSAAALADDLARALDGSPILARPSSMMEKLAKRARRNKAVSVALAVLAFVLVAGAAGSVVAWRLWGAETAKLRADQQEARREKEEAERQARSARGLLERGRAVSAVLRSAEVELGDLARALASAQHARRPRADLQALGETSWPRVEAFETSVPGDAASQATWLAAKGYLRALTAREEEAAVLYHRAKLADPDVAWASFFEGFIWFARAVELRPWPAPRVADGALVFGGGASAGPRETEALEKSGRVLAAARRFEVWGEVSADAFREVLDGILLAREGSWAASLPGLTRALRLPELSWAREDFLLARARACAATGALEDALADLDRAVHGQPDRPSLHRRRGVVLHALALRPGGADAAERLTEALKALDESVRLEPDGVENRAARAAALALAADRFAGDDAGLRALLDKALEDADAAVLRDARNPLRFRLRGALWRRLAEFRETRGLDPSETYTKALADFHDEVRLSPGSVEALRSRGRAFLSLAEAQGKRGLDPRAGLSKAIEDFGAVLAADPKDVRALRERGIAYTDLAMSEVFREIRPFRNFERAFEDLDAAVSLDPKDVFARFNRGIARFNRGVVEAQGDRDASPWFRSAAEDFEAALAGGLDGPEPYFRRSRSYRYLGDQEAERGRDPAAWYDKSLLSLREGLAEMPASERLADALGDLLEYLGRFGEAVEVYEAAVKAGLESGKLEMKIRYAREFAQGPPWVRDAFTGNRAAELGHFVTARPFLERALGPALEADFAKEPDTLTHLHAVLLRLAGALAFAAQGKAGRLAEPASVSAEEAEALRERAMELLRMLVEKGYDNFVVLRADPGLAPLHDRPAFEALIKTLEEKARKK